MYITASNSIDLRKQRYISHFANLWLNFCDLQSLSRYCCCINKSTIVVKKKSSLSSNSTPNRIQLTFFLFYYSQFFSLQYFQLPFNSFHSYNYIHSFHKLKKILALVHKKCISNKHLIFDISIHYFYIHEHVANKVFSLFPLYFLYPLHQEDSMGEKLGPDSDNLFV